jgi:L-threonylcarbamoyladenylate synthase
MQTTDIDVAAAAIHDGELVAYPTETVYGLGADALDSAAVEAVFDAKGRDRDDPVSLGVATVADAMAYVTVSDRERAFIDDFLPGPVTVVCQRREVVPDVLTAGRERVGVRVPDHDVAQALLAAAGPLTATSANVSGQPSARRIEEIQPALQERLAVLLDGGETPGGGSTVVDVDSGEVHRRGRRADAVDEWLATH